MAAYLKFTGWALLATVLFQAVFIVVQRLRRASEARRRGCKNPPSFRKAPWDPLGIQFVRAALRSTEEQTFPLFVMDINRTLCAQEGRNVTTNQSTILGRTNIVTNEPKNVQALLAHQFHDFGLGTLRRGNFLPMFGNGIFTTDGQAWEHSRALLRPNFARDQVSDLDLEERHVQDMMKALPVDDAGWTDKVDLQVLFFRLTLDSATEFLFGESVHSQSNNLPSTIQKSHNHKASLDEKQFAWAFDTGQLWLARRGRYAGLYWLLNPKEFRDCNKIVHGFIDHFVQLALNQERKEKVLEEGGNPASEKYIFSHALAKQTQDPIELRSQLANILLAGRDTTASLLGWVFYLLARHPAVFQKLRKTVVDEFGTYRDGKERDISFSKLKNCQYLQHCLNETLRLYPLVPFNSRQALKDTTIPLGGGPKGLDPVFVPKGTMVDYSVFVMHRRKDLWGEDADDFKPERWQNRRPGWDYLPFNGGPRICIGQQFALTEASYVTVRLLQRFAEIENCEPDPDVKYGLTLTMCSGNGVKVRLREDRA